MERKIKSFIKCPACKSEMIIEGFDTHKPSQGYTRKCTKCGYEMPGIMTVEIKETDKELE